MELTVVRFPTVTIVQVSRTLWASAAMRGETPARSKLVMNRWRLATLRRRVATEADLHVKKSVVEVVGAPLTWAILVDDKVNR